MKSHRRFKIQHEYNPQVFFRVFIVVQKKLDGLPRKVKRSYAYRTIPVKRFFERLDDICFLYFYRRDLRSKYNLDVSRCIKLTVTSVKYANDWPRQNDFEMVYVLAKYS